jgi:integrase
MRQINRLSARAVESLRKVGRHADGGGLYLVIHRSGAKRWSFLFRWHGKPTELGLGGLSAVSLGRARALARDCRALLAEGKSPLAERRSARTEAMTFGAFADDYVATKQGGWKNAKHRGQWIKSIREEAASLRRLPIAEVETADVLGTLKPIWLEKPETASRLRGRIEAVLNAAKAAGHRSGENPAAWRGHLDHLLPKRRRLVRGHHKAMAYADVPAFLAALHERPTVASLALEFVILTAARTGEALGARWDEIDAASKIWTVPKTRMKAEREHRVPLSDRALAVLAEARALGGEFIFPGQRRRKPLSNMALAMLLRRMKIEDVTVHGFRSAFRDWAGDKTTFPREVAEAALAHATGDETEQAYRRSDALEKRRRLMDAWAKYLTATPATVIALRPGGVSRT